MLHFVVGTIMYNYNTVEQALIIVLEYCLRDGISLIALLCIFSLVCMSSNIDS